MSVSGSQGPVRRASAERRSAGWVALVGVGPGDGALLTVRGAELLGQAGLVVAGPELAGAPGGGLGGRPG